MNYNEYIGHPTQLAGVEEVALLKGKGKGMTLLNVRNGKGLAFSLSADRAMDISRLSFKGDNMGFFAPSGYVAPSYFDKEGLGFLKSFTAGFQTTCGLASAGSPCEDEGENLPLHGTISNTPCENYSYHETDDVIIVEASVRDAYLFGKKLVLNRKFVCSKNENKLTIEDCIKNVDSKPSPCMILYHFNMGYPLVSENAIVDIPSNSVKGRNEISEADIEKALVMEKPQVGYEERCFFHDVKAENGEARVSIFNPDINKGLKMSFDKKTLDWFIEWKMMGVGEYVLGLEPANCTPDGRKVMRENGTLKFVAPNEEYKTRVTFEFFEK